VEYEDLYAHLAHGPLQAWLDRGLVRSLQAAHAAPHGDMERWQQAIRQLPQTRPSRIILDADTITIGTKADLSDSERKQTEDALRLLHPWRKGPYDFFGIGIDTEWRSDWKWKRIAPHIEPLRGRTVLDVGCGNGYHCWRMAAAGAGTVIGIDPTWLYVMQYRAMRRYITKPPVWVLPLGIEQLAADLGAFDTVFSMGVLYHRRSPFDHLRELRQALRPGGQLVLETLIVEGDQNTVFLPPGRYASMRNVWFLPSSAALEKWLLRAGFRNVHLIDDTVTSTQEQRSTDWMRFHSLPDFLDPTDPGRTVEGHPAPRRVTFTASSPW